MFLYLPIFVGFQRLSNDLDLITSLSILVKGLRNESPRHFIRFLRGHNCRVKYSKTSKMFLCNNTNSNLSVSINIPYFLFTIKPKPFEKCLFHQQRWECSND